VSPIQSHMTLKFTGGIGYKLINTNVDWLAKHTKTMQYITTRDCNCSGNYM